MIRGILFDLGGTLHTGSIPPGRDVWFAQRLLTRLSDYGIDLPVTPEELAAKLPVNSEIYKHESEQTLRELPPAEIWNDYYLREYGIGRERLAPIAEELSFLYDYERPRVMRRPHLHETMETLRGMGLKLGVISNTAALYQVFDSLEEYGIRDFFQDVTLSSVTGFRKPCRDIFTVSLRQMRSKPEECVYVGDTVSRDVIGSKRAGFAAAVQIGSKLTKEKDQALDQALAPDVVIEDIYDVARVVREMAEAGPLSPRFIPAR